MKFTTQQFCDHAEGSLAEGAICHWKTIRMELCSGHVLGSCLARNRRAAISLRSTVQFDQSLSATSSQTQRPVFVPKLFDKQFRSTTLS